jgi:hypothetical protein
MIILRRRLSWWSFALLGALAACGGGSSPKDPGSGGQSGAAGGQSGAAGGQSGAAGGQSGAGGGCASQGQNCSARSCCAGLICAGTTCQPPVSDRNMKRDFAPVDRDGVLEALSALPISTWRYQTEQPGARHIGPMAQDFKATFNVGSSDRTILQVDGDGVALAAIQALRERVVQLEKRNAELARQVAALRARRSSP